MLKIENISKLKEIIEKLSVRVVLNCLLANRSMDDFAEIQFESTFCLFQIEYYGKD